MHSSEWSLVAFTLLGQLSAGLMVCLMTITMATSKNIQISKNHIQTLKNGAIVAFGAMVLALVISFFHLSAPFSSVFALSNLQYSWLSREIFMASFFTAVLFLLLLVIHYGKPSASRNLLLLSFASVAGIILVYSMAMLYRIPTVPAWNSSATILNFFSATLVLGAAGTWLLYLLQNAASQKNIQRPLLTAFVCALILKVVAYISPSHSYAGENIAFPVEGYSVLLPEILWGIALVLILFKIFYAEDNSNLKTKQTFQYLPLVFFILAEILLRITFYSSFYRVGL